MVFLNSAKPLSTCAWLGEADLLSITQVLSRMPTARPVADT
jgi:hypothetical protein